MAVRSCRHDTAHCAKVASGGEAFPVHPHQSPRQWLRLTRSPGWVITSIYLGERRAQHNLSREHGTDLMRKGFPGEVHPIPPLDTRNAHWVFIGSEKSYTKKPIHFFNPLFSKLIDHETFQLSLAIILIDIQQNQCLWCVFSLKSFGDAKKVYFWTIPP